MALLDKIREKYIYLVVLSLLILLGCVIWFYQAGNMGYEDARVYLEALTGIGTLALLYFAYFNVASKKEEDIARLELAVRPILVWELEGDGNRAILKYKTLKHPIYDFKAVLHSGGKRLALNERHLDVFEANPNSERKRDITSFVSDCIGKKSARTLEISFAYHSEAGGDYVLVFTKEMLRKANGFSFEHRKFVSAKYPWRGKPVIFDSGD